MLSENLNLRLGEADYHPHAAFSLSFTPFQVACGKMVQPPGSLCVTQCCLGRGCHPEMGQQLALRWPQAGGRTIPALVQKLNGQHLAPKTPGRHKWCLQSTGSVTALVTAKAGLGTGEGCSPSPGKRQSQEFPGSPKPWIAVTSSLHLWGNSRGRVALAGV